MSTNELHNQLQQRDWPAVQGAMGRFAREMLQGESMSMDDCHSIVSQTMLRHIHA